jgi:hypothetical protein
MQASPKIPNALADKEVKRTTVILEKNERELVEALIKDGKEPGIKQLISKMLDIYRSLMVQDWKYPGEYYMGISRVAFVNVEFLNILTQQVPKERWRETGQKIGDALRVSVESTLGIEADKQENWEAVFTRLRVQGFGDFHLKDKFLLLKTPFIGDCEIWRGIMESLLCVELEVRNSVPPLVFLVKKRNSAPV